MILQVFVYLEVIVVMTVMPVAVRGPLAGAVMERLSAWLASEHYATTMVPQVLGVARGLSVFMAGRDIALGALSAEVLEAFGAEYGQGVPGHVLVRVRMPALRRFLIESGYLTDADVVRKRARRPRDDGCAGQRRGGSRAGRMGLLAARGARDQ